MSQKQDLYSGIPWANVTREQARAHPQGQLNLILWGIALYLIGSGLWKTWMLWQADMPLMAIGLSGLLPVLTGLGLIIRAPWAVVLAVILAGLGAFAFVKALGQGVDPAILIDGLIAVGVLTYLLEGDRPNLIYRHRYRKYSALKEKDDV